MVSMKWCLNTKKGIQLAGPNNNMSDSYIRMAEESLQILKKLGESKLWTASTAYYTIYYCLYSVMMKTGVKCEIHSCSLEFMRRCLLGLYNSEDMALVETAFDLRNDLQYYPERFVDDIKLKLVKTSAADFLVKTREILAKITEKQINQIRSSLKG